MATSTNGKTQNDCKCGCGTKVARNFAPGHDAKLASSLRAQFAEGTLTMAKAQAAADKIGSEKFSAKVAKSLARAQEDKDAAKRDAEAKAKAEK